MIFINLLFIKFSEKRDGKEYHICMKSLLCDISLSYLIFLYQLLKLTKLYLDLYLYNMHTLFLNESKILKIFTII